MSSIICRNLIMKLVMMNDDDAEGSDDGFCNDNDFEDDFDDDITSS